jgi:indolepyruvate ferredoxin oxidoreductase alpha subunit
VSLPRSRLEPLVIAEARCNRCRACLALGCPAIAYHGGEAMEIDPLACSGCALCAPRCRARAIGPALLRAG